MYTVGLGKIFTMKMRYDARHFKELSSWHLAGWPSRPQGRGDRVQQGDRHTRHRQET
jgi:hypothetical protein